MTVNQSKRTTRKILGIRAFSSGTVEIDISLKEKNTARNSSDLGSVPGKELKAESPKDSVSDSKSTESEAILCKETLTQLVVNARKEDGKYKGIFEIIISPSNLALA